MNPFIDHDKRLGIVFMDYSLELMYLVFGHHDVENVGFLMGIGCLL